MTSESYPLTKEKNATMMGMNNDSNNKSLIITTAFVVFYFIICLEDLHDFFFARNCDLYWLYHAAKISKRILKQIFLYRKFGCLSHGFHWSDQVSQGQG